MTIFRLASARAEASGSERRMVARTRQPTRTRVADAVASPRHPLASVKYLYVRVGI